MGKENEIYEPLKTPPKSSMWDKCKRERKGRKGYLVAITLTPDIAILSLNYKITETLVSIARLQAI